jgi:hypothetical protein
LNSTIAIILGASSWPKSPAAFPGSQNFANSARDLVAYLRSSTGLNLPASAILDLFDSPEDQGEIDHAIETFIRERLTDRASDATVIVYFTGHGAFTEGDRQYCFALASSRAGKLHATGYRVASLAHTLNQCAGTARRFLIFDACFAAAAHQHFMPQSANVEQMSSHARAALVRHGTALLSAASSADVAVIPASSAYTMFSEALLATLHEGSARLGDLLSMDDIQDLILSYVQRRYRDEAVRSEISVPDQRWGDLAAFGLFPNRAKMPLESLATAAEIDFRPESSESPLADPPRLNEMGPLQNDMALSRAYFERTNHVKQISKELIRNSNFSFVLVILAVIIIIVLFMLSDDILRWLLR